MAEFLLFALANIFNPYNLIIMTIGVAAGIIVGALPGLTATMALALLVPFTFTMDASLGLMVLGGVYVGAMYGGCIAAILINTPGTPASIATTFDGYPLAQKGKAEHALVAASFSSGVGGVIGGIVLLLLSPLLAAIGLKFGPPEYFWLAVFGLTIIATLSTGSMLKGLIGGALGLLLSTIGIAPIGGDMRFSFGFHQLQAGLELIVALIGFFCVPEVLKMVEKKLGGPDLIKYKPQKGVGPQVMLELIKKPILLLRSSLIGCFVGIIPGAGGNIASLMSYNEAVRYAKNKEEYGTGVIDGVAASEASNNAEVGGSLVPLLTLGIPGAAPAAVILGALMLQGIRPGPELYTTFGGITYTFLLSFILANVVMFVLGYFGARHVARLIMLPANMLAPLIVFLTVIGSFAIRNNMIDVWIMLIFGIIGYVTQKLGFHPGPIVLGLILGPIAENGLVQSMLMGKSAGSMFAVFFTRPISMVLIGICIISIVIPLLAFLRKRKKESGQIQEMEKSSGFLNSTALASLVFIAVSVIALVMTGKMTEMGGFFPRVIAVIVLLISVLQLGVSLYVRNKEQPFAEIEMTKVLCMVAGMAAYLLMMVYFGFVIAGILFLTFFFYYLSKNKGEQKYSHFRGVAMATVASVGFFSLFYYVFMVPLPIGFFFGG